MSDQLNINKEEKSRIFQFNFSDSIRVKLYKEMKYIEPRIWSREHHLMRMLSLAFSVNFTIYSLWRIYYNTNYLSKFLNRKIWILTMLIVNTSVFYFNIFLIHKLAYDEYYKDLTDEEFYSMYESLVFSQKKKNI